jgi:hypothetical protein
MLLWNLLIVNDLGILDLRLLNEAHKSTANVLTERAPVGFAALRHVAAANLN